MCIYLYAHSIDMFTEVVDDIAMLQVGDIVKVVPGERVCGCCCCC